MSGVFWMVLKLTHLGQDVYWPASLLRTLGGILRTL